MSNKNSGRVMTTMQKILGTAGGLPVSLTHDGVQLTSDTPVQERSYYVNRILNSSRRKTREVTIGTSGLLDVYELELTPMEVLDAMRYGNIDIFVDGVRAIDSYEGSHLAWNLHKNLIRVNRTLTPYTRVVIHVYPPG